EHALLSDLSGPALEAPLAYEPPRSIGVSFEMPLSLVNSMTTAIFNELWFRKAPKARQGELQTFDAFFYPLDRVAAWNRIYGPHGFTQYQFVVPFESADAVRSVIEQIQHFGVSPSLAVLKRFGESDPAPLSFPMPGWTLALDVPLGKPGLSTLFDELDALVARSGGRVYLAKDGRLRPSLLSSMYPRIESWRETRRLADPDGRFASDLARRLDLAGMHSAAPA
ncbi:MAG TPA: D-arabinono-1,4-lactone oxidase, partial [Acidimicrobiales bacterium]|nr:D-arabinono-1,4-lactone oxidase [Acidimicrobiales bacterium]